MKRSTYVPIIVAAVLILISTLGCTRELMRGGDQKVQPFTQEQLSGMQGEQTIQQSGAGPDGIPAKEPFDQIADETGGSTNPEVAEFMKQGREAIQQEKFAVAIDMFTKVIAIEPKNTRALFNLGYAYRQNGDVERAIEFSRKAVEADPKQLGVHQNLGYAYEKKGDKDSAIAEFETELQNHPDEPKLASLAEKLSMMYLDKSLMDEAFDAASRAVKLAPTEAASYAILAKVHLKNKAYDPAIVALQKAVALAPKSAQYKKFLADAFWEAGKKDDAKKAYAEAIALDPSIKKIIDPERLPGGESSDTKAGEKTGK
jgi:tetratricopeptide (TPR) repeat protein